MKKETPKEDEIKLPKDAERFTAHVKNSGGYTLGEVHNFNNTPYRLAAILNDGDGVALEFVRVN